MYVENDWRIAKRGQNIFQVEEEKEVNEGPSGDGKGNVVTEKKLLEHNIPYSVVYLMEQCKKYFLASKEREIDNKDRLYLN